MVPWNLGRVVPLALTLIAGAAVLPLARDRARTSAQDTPMTHQAADAVTLAAVNRFNEAVNRQDLSALVAAMTDDIVFENTNPQPDGTRYAGREAVSAFWARWFAANAGAVFEAEETIVAGDRCTVRWIYRKMRDGKPWHLRGVDVFRVRDGKVAEKLSYVKG